MSRSVVLVALLVAGCSSSSSPSDGPRQDKDINWGDRRPVPQRPEPTSAPSPPVSSAK